MSEMDLIPLAEAAAREASPAGELRGRSWLRPVRTALSSLRRQRQKSGEAGAARWLADNWYLAEREGRAALAALSGSKHLRRTQNGEAVVLCCCAAYLDSGADVTAQSLEAWLTAWQTVTPLRQAEQAALLSALRAALVLGLAAVYETGAGEDAARRCFTALRTLAALDLAEVLERTDALHRRLLRDPAGVYPKMDPASRAAYRAEIARQARRQNAEEAELADRLLERANQSPGRERHIGFAIRAGEQSVPSGRGYILSLCLLSLFGAGLIGLLARSALAAVLLVLPFSELVKQIADQILLPFTPPRPVPRLELANGVPKAGQTLCVVSALLTRPEDASAFAARLEELRLCSRDAGSHLLFGLLADLPESRHETDAEDAKTLSETRRAVAALNKRYGGGFYLFTRPRTFSERDRVWRGRERKRGALLALAGLLRGHKTELLCAEGDVTALPGTRYLLTLDADTVLTPGAAKELIAAMLHPLNAPRIDPDTRVVTAGYALLHPRVSTDLESATATDFARVFAGPGGTDPYGGRCAELYMERFDCGGFAGKGILDIDALLACCRDLPDERILSHDAIEGALLRGGYLGETEVTDGFPASPLSFWARLERWTRGDWQNLPYLLRAGLRPMDRFRLADSLRRSLVPPATLLALAAGLWLRAPGLRLAAWAALACLLSQLLLALGRGMLRPDAQARARYYGLSLHGLALALAQTLLRLAFLPYESWITVSAAVRALWRGFVSGRGCLAWQTAAQSEAAKRGTVQGYYTAMVPAWIAGIAFLLLAPSAAGKTAGAVWALSPLLACSLSRPKPPARPLSAADRDYLLDRAREIWRFFAEFCTEEDHWLPPDNVQIHPPAGAAHRTSPTNLGLGLLSALCADALGVDGGAGLPLAEHMLGTMETLPRWKGHFYNWYHTITLKPLQPAYVSTVDSGNLAACLTAAAGAFRERGRADLARRCEALLAPMDFLSLYDLSRRLFRIGVDARTGEPSPGWYDLMSSEARLTGYLAIARGDVDKRHWRSLSRAQVQLDRYRGMASWTGTMFEYLMPELFLPLESESLLWESAKFCLYAQKRRVPASLPWGISESGFYSLDNTLHYRYKAHGVAALALCRGMDRELVISPYSSFLALAVEQRAAVRNLRRLEKRGMLGPYGFWEALDCTPGRSLDGRGEIVRSVMAHHLGMSLAAVTNCLLNGAVQKWTMANPAMRAHRSLLQERVPVGAALLRRPPEEKPRRTVSRVPVTYRREGTGTDAAAPAACLLSNGEGHLPAPETGAFQPRWRERELLAAPLRLRFLREDGSETLFPLTGGEAASWAFSPETARIRASRGDLSAELTAAVSETDAGFLFTLALSSKTGETGALELTLLPALARRADLESHPAFWRLGLLEKRRAGTVLWQRLPRGDQPGLWMALAAEPPLSEETAERWLHDGRTVLCRSCDLPAGQTQYRRFALAVGPNQEAAEQAAQRTLAMPPERASALPARLAAQMGLDSDSLSEAMAMVGPLRSDYLPDAPARLRRRDALWALGVSGDVPILAADFAPAEHRSRALRLIAQHALLSACGLAFDLVFLADDGGDYRRANADTLRELLSAADRTALFQAKGGVHLTAARDIILAGAALTASAGGVIFPERNTLPCLPAAKDRRDLILPPPDWNTEPDGTVRVRLEGTLPRRVWSVPLTNGSFSCTAADSGCGDLWYRNARENRITPWRNDPWAVSGPERLEALTPAGPVSLFADGEGERTVCFAFGCAVWETRRAEVSARVTAFVPMGTDARVLLVETQPPLPLRWRVDLALAGEPRQACALVTRMEDGVFSAANPRADAPFAVTALCSPEIRRFTASRSDADRGTLTGFTGSGVPGCFCAEFAPSDRAVLLVGCAPAGRLQPLLRFDAALKSLEDTRAFWARFAASFSADAPDAAFSRYVSGWAAYQTMACRLMARSSVYQSGGAVGFRDQLQDAVNLLLLGAASARRQILLCCAHQFPEGDVCHWWHPGAGEERGVRTRISDDLLWLGWALVEYTEKTGDTALCLERTPWLSSSPLEDGERERYAPLVPTRETATVIEHAVRAVQCVLRRGVGEHGLLRMGSGDWNDGFDRVEGESVWLSFFFSHVAHRLADLLQALGVSGAEALRRAAETIGAAGESAWDGAWYRRGYYAAGALLGSRESDACQIDAIAQSWAVFCPETTEARRKRALESALERLYDREHSLVKLFDPPFRALSPDPGYVRSYGPGFRENGGQYTHGAVWLAAALLREGKAREGRDILCSLLPERHPEDRYEAEPFVLAADVYAGDAPETAGWSWYTGAAGWYLRTASEELFGLRLRAGQLFVERPCLPDDWPGVSLRWRDGNGVTHTVEYRADAIFVDNEPYTGGPVGPVRQ